MPRRRSNRFASSSSRTPSPKKKISPIKKLVLRRTSQTPERTLYQIIRSPPIKPTTTFLEESYDEKSLSPPPLLKQQKKNKSSHERNPIRNDRQNFNIFGLEESAGDESEQEEFETVQRSKKRKKKTLKKGKKPKEVSPEMMVKLNKEIIDGGYEGIGVIQDTLSLLEQSLSALTDPSLILTPEGKEYERAGKFAEPTFANSRIRDQLADKLSKVNIKNDIFDFDKRTVSRQDIPVRRNSKSRRASTSGKLSKAGSSMVDDIDMETLPTEIEFERILRPKFKPKRTLEAQTLNNIENNMEVDHHTVSPHRDNDHLVPASKSKSKRTSISGMVNKASYESSLVDVPDTVPLPVDAGFERILRPKSKSKPSLKSETLKSVENEMDVDHHTVLPTVLPHHDNDQVFPASKSKSKRTSKSGSVKTASDLLYPETFPKYESTFESPNFLLQVKPDENKQNEVLSEDSFELKIEESFVKSAVVEEQTRAKLNVDDMIVEDGQRDTVLEISKDVEPIPKTKSKSKKKVETKAEQNGKVSTPKQDTVIGDIQNLNNVGNFEEDIVMASSSKERLDEKLAKANIKNADIDQNTVSNPEVPAEKVTKSKSTSKSVNFNIDSLLMNNENAVDQDTVLHSGIPVEKENFSPFAFTKQQLEKLKSQQIPMNDSTVSAAKDKSSTTTTIPNLTNNKLEDDKPKISTYPPFCFTTEQLERLKSQQPPTHEPIPKGPVAVKLVPQNRSCAPVFIQITQKDFHRMLPKMPQLQPINK